MTRMAIDIGSGLGIDERIAEMIMVDHDRFESELRKSDDACDRAVAAMVTDNFALAAAELDQAPPSLRCDALRGALARLSGSPERAIEILEGLLDHQHVPLRRAMLLRHLGKAEHVAGLHEAAVDHLRRAVDLRRANQAPADQIASSELMLAIAERAATA